MNTISISDLTKDYGDNKGIFNVSFNVKEGEVVGFLGSNGAGKTTAIRHLMGFIKPDQGSCQILGLDCFKEASKVQKKVGYLPGEIAFMDKMSGLEFIKFMAEMKNIKDLKYAEELIEYLELDTKVKIKKMSKGMKQKVGLVIAFMQDAPILILDEPTSGLDPLMQNKFIELIKKEKCKGKSILMSSHIFEEIENTCDRIVMIKDGRIVANEDMNKIKLDRSKYYEITFLNEYSAKLFQNNYPNSTRIERTVRFLLKGNIKKLLNELNKYDIEDMNVRHQTLEEVFIQYYGGKKDE
ncbi:ABC transporter ATP-binding protein [Thomasclavelia saccharogumia]|uniref:ABC transporter ATP-binding protein n=1 Tax=Thomasclavelia saccharogumia TaxID=341225 RepID=UPI00047E0FF8|nr:ABC transporter ATP-binding protein [Thomasclavelia saccharogumia]